LDVDLASNEALIEEVQTDWLRLAAARLKYFAENTPEGEQPEDIARRKRLDRARAYVNEVLKPHEKLWDKAMLTATLSFLKDELGLKTVYIHDADCGAKIKNISGRLPPRSLYTKLPKSFCFEPTQDGPQFLADNQSAIYQIMKRKKTLRFWRHEF
ncbi:MAG: hypothetical protein AAFV62_14430, partial [Pseudomonadota bacterium]